MKPALVLAALLAFAGPALAQQPTAAPTGNPTATQPSPKAAASMQRFSGVWVEGGGFDIKYGGDYEACAARCLATAKCVMIEYYRPEKKCNMYDKERPRLKGGSSDVALKMGAALKTDAAAKADGLKADGAPKANGAPKADGALKKP